MCAGAGGDAVVGVQRVRHLGGVPVPEVQRHDGSPAGQGKVAVDRDVVDVPDLLVEPLHQGVLRLFHRLYALRQQVVRRRVQPGDTVAVQRAGLQTGGVVLRLLPVEGVDAAAAPQQGADVHAGTDAQPAGTLRPHEPLVAGEAQYVHPQRGHVDRDRARRLGGVQNQQCAVGMGDLRDARYVQHISRQVGGMGAHHGSGVGAEQRRKVLAADAPLPVGPDEGQSHALRLQRIQGAQDGVVLQIGGDGVIRRGEKTLYGDIQRHGGVGGEHHLLRAGTAQQLRQLPPCLEHRAGRLHGRTVGAPCGVARRQNGLRHRLRHLRRLVQRGGGVIQIDELFHQYISNTKQPPWAIPASSSAAQRASRSSGSAFHARPHPAVIWEGMGIIRPGSPASWNSASAAMA